MAFAPNGKDVLEGVAESIELLTAEDKCLEIDRLKPQPRYLPCNALTVVSSSVAGVPSANVTIAVVAFRSVDPEDKNFTPSTVRLEGMSDFTTATDVPGGRDDSCRVGFALAFSWARFRTISSRASSSSVNAALASRLSCSSYAKIP